ncbi:dihydroxyacetone kinase subunit DhaK [Oceanobacillus kimchii]|uniref:dihydroxyacetone kinase subunit DhaK n=1 Tax=Oceanobacillus kimchii TaxID=746691 RepID=UPI0021A4AFB6|nr:dihydroxyacetone kinase subunit DhaK [Oceanobacillus kimchii]MCT1575727.1 dihydroxyacetone kinase subunit DhaK [Oceanobacillus kimchii]MCT2135364.1 dihydroxyacetone kinase subunit DhaK [Oceanobacillus kimchii]
MKKLLNNPNHVVEEMLEGYVKAHPDYIKQSNQNKRALVTTRQTKENKVGILIGGGSGHEPGFLGYVGEGMADGVAVGNIFASPSPDPILEVTKAIDKGAGVAYLHGNYAGDVMNFGMAAEMADLEEDIEVKIALGSDDVASAPKEEKKKRRGIAGEFFIFKSAGAAADFGYDLDDVIRMAEKANENSRSMGVGLSPCALPQTGEPSFELGENEMEIGLGHHGEPGIEKGPLATADEVAERLVTDILTDMPLTNQDEVAVLVNGLGSTPRMELYIIFRRVEQILSEKGIHIYRSYVGDYITSLEMGGCSVSLMKLDDELKKGIDHPVNCPMFVQK